MADRIERIGNSVIQHGRGNDRVYLMKLHPDDARDLPERLGLLAMGKGYSKIFAKVPHGTASHFLSAGFRVEAEIPGFFPDGASAVFLGKYLDPERGRERRPTLVRQVLAAAYSAVERSSGRRPALPEGCSWGIAGADDIEELAALFRKIFASYPFPIHQPSFLVEAMKSDTLYFSVRGEGELVAASSAEMDRDSRSVEMTDFATLPAYRGRGIALFLLQRMEEAMTRHGFRSFFTIARAYSFGMNITFARNGYCFGGTLTNNTNIAGSLESMNLWYKTLP